MGRSVKWVADNLGVTRKALRNYEGNGLMPPNPDSNYRDYSDDDVDRIWSIKILQGIGFTVKEIRMMFETPDFDFYYAMTEKIAELEKELDQKKQYIEFAKTIKMTGRIPITKHVGSIKYEDFLKHAREEWNFYSEPKMANMMVITETMVSKPIEEYSEDDLARLLDFLKSFNPDENVRAYTMSAYCDIIARLRFGADFSSPLVQTAVKALYGYFEKQTIGTELGNSLSPDSFARITVPSFLDGDMAVLMERNYGKEGCRFLASAIALFGGYNNPDDI